MFKNGFHLSAVAGYIILTIAVVVGFWGQERYYDHKFTDQRIQSEQDIKNAINSYNVSVCYQRQASQTKFNQLVDTIIEARTAQRDEALRVGNNELAQVHQHAVNQYKKIKIDTLTSEECNALVFR